MGVGVVCVCVWVWVRSQQPAEILYPVQMSSTLFSRGTNGQIGIRARAEKTAQDIAELQQAVTTLEQIVVQLSAEVAALKNAKPESACPSETLQTAVSPGAES